MIFLDKILNVIKQTWLPDSRLKCPWQDFDYLVLDLELTGLDAKQDEIVSVAWLTVSKQRIELSNAQYFLNKEVSQLNQSPVYHGIDASSLTEGDDLKSILLQLQQVVAGKVLVCHNIQLDWLFLLEACKAYEIELAPLAMVDTLQMEHKRLTATGQPIAQDMLTLAKCRERYHLPSYSNHNALSDAMATAELLLAQITAMGSGSNILLSQFVVNQP